MMVPIDLIHSPLPFNDLFNNQVIAHTLNSYSNITGTYKLLGLICDVSLNVAPDFGHVLTWHESVLAARFD